MTQSSAPIVILVDTETSAKKDPEVVELAYLSLCNPAEPTAEPTDDLGASTFVRRYKPTRPITLGALAVHHILDEELVDQPSSETAAQDLPSTIDYFIGHNVDFDWVALGKPDCKRIDTLSLARHAWPELDSHSLGALIYHLNREEARHLLQDAHSAVQDIILTLLIFRRTITALCESGALPHDPTWDDIYQQSELGRIPKTMPFGKHRGTPLNEVPHDYIQWALGNIADMDPYLKKGLKKVLASQDVETSTYRAPTR